MYNVNHRASQFKKIYVLNFDKYFKLNIPPIPSKYFALLVVDNSSNLDFESIDNFIINILENGMVYFATFGSNNRFITGELDVIRTCPEHYEQYSDVITANYEEDSVDDALWSFLFSPCIDDIFIDECTTAVIAINSDQKIINQVSKNIRNLSAFNKKMTEDCS
ncbi:MAG: hypothetical protein ISR65_14490 [Bacteriovoracaceae bacterium]|nr:hypothetical protein [Bacteriovoracaceae bacterium]